MIERSAYCKPLMSSIVEEFVDHEQRKISRLVMTYGRVLICDHRFGSMTDEPKDLISEQG